MNIFTAIALARDIISIGSEFAELIQRVVYLWKKGREEEAARIITIKAREQAAGRAAHEAAKNAGKSGEVD